MNLDALQTVISLHSKDNPIKSYKLEERFECNGAIIRDAIRELRRKGIPIANSPEGYYMAQNYPEIEPTVMNLESRAYSELQTAKCLRNCFNSQLNLGV